LGLSPRRESKVAVVNATRSTRGFAQRTKQSVGAWMTQVVAIRDVRLLKSSASSRAVWVCALLTKSVGQPAIALRQVLLAG